MDLFACRRGCQENSQEELRIHRTGVGTSCQASSFFRGCLHLAAQQQPWGAQRLLSCLLLSGLISAGSTLLSFLLPWWAGRVGCQSICLQKRATPACFPHGCPPFAQLDPLAPMSDVSERIQSPVLQSECIAGGARRRDDLASTINLPAFMSLNQTLKHRP